MLLCIETSTRAGSVALVDRTGVIDERVLAGDLGAELAPAVQAMVPDLSAVDAYAISVGPGLFTGLRIGIAFMKGLAVVHRRPAVAVSTLAVIARQLADAHPEATLFLPVVDARKGEVFAALYRRTDGHLALDPRVPEGVHRFDQLATIEGVWSAGAPIPAWASADPGQSIPRASVVGQIAQASLPGSAVDALGVEPAYHQPSGAEINRARGSVDVRTRSR